MIVTEKFTRKERKARIAPKDGEPLTVVEFSLLPEVKLSLIRELRPFVRGDERDDKKLKAIIERHFPAEVLEEMQSLARVDHDAHTVYVVKGLAGFRDELYPASNVGFTQSYYAPTIARGVSLALGLKTSGMAFNLLRKPGEERSPVGADLHKHSEDVTMLAVSKADGSATRFFDQQALAEDNRSKRVTVTNGKNRVGRLATMLNRFSNPRKARDVDLLPVNGVSASLPKSGTLYDRLLMEQGLEVRPEDGDLVLWPNNGRVWHQARLPEQTTMENGHFSRIAYSLSSYVSRN